MADYTAMSRCAQIIINNPKIRVVVVSAPAGITNQLLSLSEPASSPQQKLQTINTIKDHVISIAQQLKNSTRTVNTLENYLSELLNLTNTTPITPELTDTILSYGEGCSSVLLTAILNELNYKADNFDVRQVLITDSQFGEAEPQLADIKTLVHQKLFPLTKETVIITQGFIGEDPQGHTTTLGRGGSDYTASLLAEALDVDSLEIWTDVFGIFTCDPRIVKKATPLVEISFDEAAELANFGAKVLHPATLLPAIRSNINVFVGSSSHPESPGTWVLAQPSESPPIRAISLRKNQTLLTVHSLKMFHARGFLAKVFGILAQHNISVDIVTTSEVSVSLTLDNTSVGTNTKALLTPELLSELEALPNIRLEIDDDLTLIAMVGNHLHSASGISGKIFQTLAQHPIRLICYGASPHNLCLLVSAKIAEDVVTILHESFFEKEVHPL